MTTTERALDVAAGDLGIATEDLSARGKAIAILTALGTDVSRSHSLRDLRPIQSLPDELLVERAIKTAGLSR